MKSLDSKLTFPKFFLSIIFMISIIVSNLNAQPGIGISYNFVRDSGVIAPTGLTVIAVPGPNQDDFAYRISPTGLNMRFGCSSITSIVVSTNGWMALIPAGTPAGIPASLSAGSYLASNQLSNNTTGFPIIAPYWDDLASTVISYSYVAPILTVQWICRIDKNNVTAENNFWVRIDANTGAISYSYANNPNYVVAGPPTASIGIAGVCVGDYYSYDNFTTFADSTIESSAIGTKPVNVQYIFIPYQLYSNCTNARDIGPLSGSCIPLTININNAISGSAISCSPGGVDSLGIWFKIFKPAGTTSLTVTTSPSVAACQNIAGTSIEAYANCGGIPIGCSTTSIANPTFGELVLTRPPAAGELYFRVTADNDICGKFNICASSTLTCQAVINNGSDTIDDCAAGMVSLIAWSDTFSTFLWTLNGDTVSISDTLTATQSGMYHLTVTGGSCPGTDSVFVDLTSPINLSFTGLDTIYCVTNPSAVLTPSHTPGIFSGAGINGNTFDPSLAGIGTHTITYDYTTPSGCQFTTTQDTRVDACLQVSVNRSISLGVFPNPNPGEFNVIAFSKTEKIVNMDIKDMSGRILKSEKLALKAGDNKIPYHSTLAKGIYLLSISEEFDSVSLKIIIK